MRSGAIRSALSAKLLAGEVVLIEGFPALEAPNTKAVRNLLDTVALATSRLVVLDGPNDVVRLSARNLPKVRVVTTENISVYDILRHQRVVMVVGAARQLEQRYGLPMDDGHDHDHDHGHSHDEEAE
jgi:large subunit ribosomal protein L4